jgi:hypothetical protein
MLKKPKIGNLVGLGKEAGWFGEYLFILFTKKLVLLKTPNGC